jgi:hypothetical protein
MKINNLLYSKKIPVITGILTFSSLIALALLTLYSVCPAPVAADDKVNKEFEYTVYLAGFIAGKAVMKYESSGEGIKIRTRATSTGIISLFYKIDDVSESILYPDGYPRSNMLKIRQGRRKRDKKTVFERLEDGRSHKVIFRDLIENINREYDLDRPAYDILSAFYALSRRDLHVGTSEYLDIFDNKKLYNTEVQILRKERVSVPAGEFDTIVIKPLLKSEGIFVRKGDMYIWLTDDDRKLPVIVKSKIKIGHFTAKLKKGG